MYTVLVTGGIGAGKGIVCEWLAKHGASILDLDSIAKEEQEAATVQEQLAAEFGDDVIDGEGRVNRKLLASRAFATPQTAARLGEICWPPVVARVADYLVGGTCQPLDEGAFIVVEVPMLVELPALRELADEVICVNAPEELRLQRAVARGMAEADVRARMAVQATDAAREAISDTVLDNSGSLEALYEQLQDWYNQRTMGRLF
jgi:dephospho-CoA kinase